MTGALLRKFGLHHSTIVFVGSKTTSYNSGAGAQTVSLTDLKDTSNNSATLQQNDLVIVTMERTSTSDLAAATVSPSTSGYTIVASDLYANDTWDVNFAVNYKFMGASPDTTVDLPATGAGGMAVTIFALRGVNTSTPLDVAATTATGIDTANVNPASITPVTAGAMISVHGGSGVGGAGSYSTPSDLSSTTNHWRSVNIDGGTGGSIAGTGLKTDWTSGAFDPGAWSFTTDATLYSWAAITIAWRPA